MRGFERGSLKFTIRNIVTQIHPTSKHHSIL